MRAFRIVLIAALAALTPRLLQAQWSAPTTQATVVWISIDGFRHDYLQRFHPPALSRLAKEGAFTTQERPIFPSLTFPNHIAQVTGTTADKNGIPMNAFFDPAIGQQFSFPDEGSELPPNQSGSPPSARACASSRSTGRCRTGRSVNGRAISLI